MLGGTQKNIFKYSTAECLIFLRLPNSNETFCFLWSEIRPPSKVGSRYLVSCKSFIHISCLVFDGLDWNSIFVESTCQFYWDVSTIDAYVEPVVHVFTLAYFPNSCQSVPSSYHARNVSNDKLR